MNLKMPKVVAHKKNTCIVAAVPLVVIVRYLEIQYQTEWGAQRQV